MLTDDGDSQEFGQELLSLTPLSPSRRLSPSQSRRSTRQRRCPQRSARSMSSIPQCRHIGTVHLLLFACATFLSLSVTVDGQLLKNPSWVLSRILFMTLRISKATAADNRVLSASSNAPAPHPLPTPAFARSETNRRDHRRAQQLPPSRAPATRNPTSSSARPTTSPRPATNATAPTARPTSAPRPSTTPPTDVPSTAAPSASRRPSILPSNANLTVTPTLTSRPSKFPSQSPRPSVSDPPSQLPSQHPTENLLPSALPSAMPSVTHQLLHQPFLQMVLDGVDRDWNNRDVSVWQTVTSDYITSWWNTVQNSPVFVARTFTNAIPGQVIRVPPEESGGGGSHGGGGGGGGGSGPSSSSISDNSSGTVYDVPDSPLDLDLSGNNGSAVGTTSVGYNQTISFNVLPPYVINPVSKELFLLPFLSNPRTYTLLLAAATNNTGPIRIASIRIAPLPTNPPTPTPSFVAQDDKNIVIITVVITVTSLAMAGGYILYQGRVEQQEGLASLEESISYTEEDLYRQSIAMARSPAPPMSRWYGTGTSTARESASADADAEPASVTMVPPALAQPSSVAVGAMGAASAVSAATSVLSDLASAAVSAVQGLVSAPAPAQHPSGTLRFDSQLEEILEADESRTLSPSVNTAGGSDAAHNNAGTSSTSAFLGGGSAMGTMGKESIGSGGAGVPVSTSGGAAEQEGLRAEDAQTYQPRYPTYSSLPISVISDEIDMPFQHSPYPNVYPPPGSNVDPSWPPDHLYAGGAGMQNPPDGAYGMGAPQHLPLASGIPIVTDLSLSTVLNSDELDLPVSPLAMMGFQLEIQDLDDFVEGDAASSGPSHRGTDRGDDRGGKSRR